MRVMVDWGEMYPCTYVDTREDATGTGGEVSPEYFDENAIEVPAQLVVDYESALAAFWAASAAIDAAARTAYAERRIALRGKEEA